MKGGMLTIENEIKALKAIRAIIDAWQNGTIHITSVNEDFDPEHHQYDLSVIMGMISNHVHYGLGLEVPDIHKTKGESK